MQPPQKIELELQYLGEDWKVFLRRFITILGKLFADIYRRIDGAVATNITVVAGSSSTSSGTSTTAEMRVGRATVTAGSVVVSFSSAMSTTDYELVCLQKDNDGIFQLIDTHSATKSISGFTVDTFTAGTLIYVAIPRQ